MADDSLFTLGPGLDGIDAVSVNTWPTGSNCLSRKKRDKKHAPQMYCDANSQESLEEYKYGQRTIPIRSTVLGVDEDDQRNNNVSESWRVVGERRFSFSSLPTHIDKYTSRALPSSSSSAFREGKRQRFSSVSNHQGAISSEEGLSHSDTLEENIFDQGHSGYAQGSPGTPVGGCGGQQVGKEQGGSSGEDGERAERCATPAPSDSHLSAHDSFDFDSKATTTKYTIFIGNPGAGKSTLLNGLIGKALFRSGVSWGRGLTRTAQLQEGDNGEFYCDTPGLADVELREKAAKEISNALRSGEGDYKIVFVFTQDAGRVRPRDSAMMKLVLDALPGDKEIPYGIIVNRLTKTKKQVLSTDKEAFTLFAACLNASCANPTLYISLYENVEGLEDKDDVVHQPTAELVQFLKMLPSVHIMPAEVKDVKASEFDALVERLESEFLSLRDDKKKLEEAIEKNREHMEKQMKIMQKTLPPPPDSNLSAHDSFDSAVKTGREMMRLAIETPDFIPEQIPIEYIEVSTDNFLDKRQLGEGKVSMVFVGKDSVLRRKFAVKRMKLSFHAEIDLIEARRTFDKEIATLKHSRHPNIARLYAYHLDPDLHGTHCIVYELASLGSLDQMLRNEKGRLHWTTRISIALDVARALEYMHGGKGGQICFHRDVKPLNICLKRDHTALLVDCGIAKMIPLDDSKATMTVMESGGNAIRGTPGYMCPDYSYTILQGESYEYSSANDVFSLGVVMTEIFTGVLQNSLRDGKNINVYHRYSRDKEDMKRAVDKSAEDWGRLAKTRFPRLAVECMSCEPNKRPSISKIVERLGFLDSYARPRSPGEQNSITVLASSPLVYTEDGVEYAVIDAPNFGLERDLLDACIQESKRDIRLTFDTATIDRLKVAATKRCGCLHFSGHGSPHSLLFEDDKGGAHWLTKQDINFGCVNQKPFKLVFVSACHSQYIGTAFVDAGVKHVVCCKYDEIIKDDAAIKFTHHFYMALAQGYTIRNAFEEGKDATCKYCAEEANKFLLLPHGGNHDVQVFHAEDLEWAEGTSPAVLIPPVPEHFLGRKVDMYHVLQLVLNHQLVNLVGDHGIGCSSLASAVSHYINERRSTILSIESIYFLRGQDQYSGMLKELHRQLANEGRTKCSSGDNDDSLLAGLISALRAVKALVVLDDITVKDSVLISFIEHLLDASSSIRLLILTREEVNITSPYALRQVYKLGPLGKAPTVTLFGKACQIVDRNAKDDILLERVADCESLFKKIGEGIPARVLKAAEHFQKEEYENLFRVQCSCCPVVPASPPTSPSASVMSSTTQQCLDLSSVGPEIASPLQRLLHTTTAGDVQRACADLGNLTQKGDNSVMIARAGGVPVIVAVMGRHTESAAVQEHACVVLGNLCVDNNYNQMAIATAGGISALIAAMENHRESVLVQTEACAALRNLAGNNNDNCVSIAVAGGIPAIIAAMEGHKGSAAVQEQALRALRNLIAKNKFNKMAIADGDGILAVVTAMELHEDLVLVQEKACVVLRHLAFNVKSKIAIEAAGGIPRIIAAMDRHRESVQVQEMACRALINLSAKNDDNKLAIVAAGGIPLVVAAMEQHTESVAVHEEACRVLLNLSANNNSNKVAVFTAGAIPAVIAAMGCHRRSAKVQEKACRVLINLDAYGEDIITKGGVPAVLAAMEGHRGSVAVQAEACKVLYNLSFFPSSLAQMRSERVERVQQLLKAAKTRFPSECHFASSVLNKLRITDEDEDLFEIELWP